jgi:hypothetical protein
MQPILAWSLDTDDEAMTYRVSDHADSPELLTARIRYQ